MQPNNQFTEGRIFGPLIKFAIPVFFALCLQSLYGVRVPVSYFMSKLPNTTLFKIGLATPASTIVQIIFCSVCLWLVIRGERREAYGKH